jgi:hypothetical protein
MLKYVEKRMKVFSRVAWPIMGGRGCYSLSYRSQVLGLSTSTIRKSKMCGKGHWHPWIQAQSRIRNYGRKKFSHTKVNEDIKPKHMVE